MTDLRANEISRQLRQPIVLTVGPAIFYRRVAAFYVARFAQTPSECRHGRLGTGRSGVKIPDHWHRLLCARRDRPSRRRAAEQRDELAAGTHSITSSARASRVGGTSRPSALAVIKLITRSNLVGCSTGRSEGFDPCKILST